MRQWPAFRLRDIPPALRADLSRSAAYEGISIADVVRGHLCDRYLLVCKLQSYGYDRERDSGTTETLLLRLDPRLKRAIAKEAKKTGRSMHSIVMQTLETHYKRRAHVRQDG